MSLSDIKFNDSVSFFLCSIVHIWRIASCWFPIANDILALSKFTSEGLSCFQYSNKELANLNAEFFLATFNVIRLKIATFLSKLVLLVVCNELSCLDR